MINTTEIKYYLRNMPFISRMYNRCLYALKGDRFDYNSLKSVIPKFSSFNKVRITLVVPSFESDFVFGGLTTAIKIFNNIIEETGAKGRIVVLNGSYSKKSTFRVSGFDYKKNLFFCSDSTRIEVGRNDFFMCTFWTTVYSFMPLLQEQIQYYKLKNRKLVYLIQDFEPGFYSWSTEYALAESTYKENFNNITAVFNAHSLYKYFKNNNYKFGEEIVFSPQLSSKLAEYLPKNRSSRKKQILIYGRPRVDRNAFELIRASLDMWSRTYPDSKNWKIISLGADFKDIKLGNNLIEFKGKVSLAEYADYMRNSFAGISLMISPHPSYPPLEMSTFGVKTITNSFSNKNLADFNDNVYNVDVCDPRIICNTLSDICNLYEKDSYGVPTYNDDYLNGKSFEQAIAQISSSVENMIGK